MATLATTRLAARQRTDKVNSQFVTDSELTSYVNASYLELYDFLVQKYGDDYFVGTPYQFTTDGVNQLFSLPANCHKLLGVDVQLYSGSPNSWLTCKPFNFGERNRYSVPGVSIAYAGMCNIYYRMMGQQMMFVPLPQAGLVIRLWFVPKLTPLVSDSDVLDISITGAGWDEYVVVDCAIKMLAKEESDVSTFMAQKAELLRRIESAAANRDVGNPQTVTDVTSNSGDGAGGPLWGGW